MTEDLKVLYVEDEENIRKSLKKAIGHEFRQFVTACDGEDGLKKFKKTKFDLIISDISMPKLDGLEMTKEIKKISKKIPIILLSAYSEKEKLLKAIELGIHRYFIKPIAPEELLETIALLSEQEMKIKLLNPYVFDIKKNLLLCDKVRVNLTKKELHFVTFLLKRDGEIASKESIKNAIWKDYSADDTLLRALVKRLRNKTNKSLILNSVGLGYKINI